jgi:hypothetical protein
LRTLIDMDFLGLDWRADARVRFAMAKTPVFAVFWNGPQGRTRRSSANLSERYSGSVTLSRIIFLSLPIALNRG